MILTQAGDTITYGKDELLFRFRNSKLNSERFTASDVDDARLQLVEAYPEDIVEIDRYALRVLAILP